MSASVVPSQNVKWNAFDINKLNFSKPVNKKDGSRDLYLNYNDIKGKIIIEAPKLIVKFFNANPNKSDASKMNYSISVACENPEFYEIFGNQLDSHLIESAVTNSSAWFGKDKDSDIITDIYYPFYKKAKEGTSYPPMMTLKFYDNQVADMFIDKNNQPIEAKDLETVLVRDTYINAIFKLSAVNCTDSAMRVNAELVRCRIIEKGSSTRVGVDISTIDVSSLKLGKVELHKKGGKFTRLIGKNGAITIKFKDVRLAPYPVHSVNDKGEEMHGISVILESQDQQEFFKSVDTLIKKELTSRSVEFYGKKRTAAQVDGKYINQSRYSKKDAAEIAAGKQPQYPPSLRVKVMVDNDEHTKCVGITVVKADGTPFEGDINEIIPVSREKTFEIDITCRHIWFGKDGESVGWVLNRIVVDENSVVASNIRFSDEDECDVSGDDQSDEAGQGKTADAADSSDAGDD
jgi:hypothetical protein